jgi:hypothetical protein
MTQRSWLGVKGKFSRGKKEKGEKEGKTHLKLERTTKRPLPSLPRRFSTGTFTLSKVIYAVPAA